MYLHLYETLTINFNGATFVREWEKKRAALGEGIKLERLCRPTQAVCFAGGSHWNLRQAHYVLQHLDVSY